MVSWPFHVCLMPSLRMNVVLLPLLLYDFMTWAGTTLPLYRLNIRHTANKYKLTLILLTRRIWWASNNTSRWQMRINSVFKVLNRILFLAFLWSYVYNTCVRRVWIVWHRKCGRIPELKPWDLAANTHCNLYTDSNNGCERLEDKS